jgi:hypothetical protein
MRKILYGVALGVFLATMFVSVSAGGGVPGAIFTTVANGSEVNYNIYPSKDAVYLDGGPGPGAPQGAAGLDDGIYVFQVTDPSGKTLLSTDPAACRLFTVADGIIVSTAPSVCPHVTGLDVDHGALTVQLMPYNDTPNPGGEYKVWATPLGNYLCATNLNIVDCPKKGSGAKHGFVPRYSKTDNFKVAGDPLEIDTRFHDPSWNFLDGRMITWTDTLGASNNKWSYENLALDIHHEAHVENVEVGTHSISISNQAGCTVGNVYLSGVATGVVGPQIVNVNVPDDFGGNTVFIDVACK